MSVSPADILPSQEQPSAIDWRGRPIRCICCIGAGYVGGPTSAVLAARLPDVQVIVADLDARRIDAWKSSRLPIYEPGLAGLVYAARDGAKGRPGPNLRFTTAVAEAVAAAQIVFISVNTPAKSNGLGAGYATDLGSIESATRVIAQAAQFDTIVVEKSTVPCRTAESVRDILAANGRPGVHFDVLSNPEFLAEGTAVSDLTDPDRILIGSLPGSDGLAAAAALVALYRTWVPAERIVTMNLFSSELAKVAANALLAQRISSINSLSAICEATGADVDEVANAVGLDGRIGPKMLKPSVGFGGSCFKKDLLSLVYLAQTLHLPEVAAYWLSVVDINEWQKERFTRRIITSLYNNLIEKKVAIFGFAYKKNTGDTRGSAAVSVANSLIEERAHVAVYDPQVRREQILADLCQSRDDHSVVHEHVSICDDPYAACHGAHAVVIVTEWDEFKGPFDVSNGEGHTNSTTQHPGADRIENGNRAGSYVDWHRIAGMMQKPMFVFDGRGVVNQHGLRGLGFRVESIGNAASR